MLEKKKTSQICYMPKKKFCGIVKTEQERRKEVILMSQKNHKMIDGKLLQTDKKYAQLKLKQKEKIAEWMFQATRDYYTKKYTFPNDKHLEEVVDIVYEKI